MRAAVKRRGSTMWRRSLLWRRRTGHAAAPRADRPEHRAGRRHGGVEWLQRRLVDVVAFGVAGAGTGRPLTRARAVHRQDQHHRLAGDEPDVGDGSTDDEHGRRRRRRPLNKRTVIEKVVVMPSDSKPTESGKGCERLSGAAEERAHLRGERADDVGDVHLPRRRPGTSRSLSTTSATSVMSWRHPASKSGSSVKKTSAVNGRARGPIMGTARSKEACCPGRGRAPGASR